MAEITKHSSEPDPHGSNANVSHERGDIDIFQISAFGLGLFISCAVVAVAMWAMFHFLNHREDLASRPSAMASEKQSLPPEPRLQGINRPVSPHVEMQELRAEEDTILSSYGLLDPTKGVARIPVAVAIELTAQKGLPYRLTGSGSDNDGFRMIPSDASGGRTLEKISQ